MQTVPRVTDLFKEFPLKIASSQPLSENKNYPRIEENTKAIFICVSSPPIWIDSELVETKKVQKKHSDDLQCIFNPLDYQADFHMKFAIIWGTLSRHSI